MLGINVVAVIAFVVGYKKYFLIHVKKPDSRQVY